jgi:hypothetical protein
MELTFLEKLVIKISKNNYHKRGSRLDLIKKVWAKQLDIEINELTEKYISNKLRDLYFKITRPSITEVLQTIDELDNHLFNTPLAFWMNKLSLLPVNKTLDQINIVLLDLKISKKDFPKLIKLLK